eukprot:scpid67459/ scgid21855/ 
MNIITRTLFKHRLLHPTLSSYRSQDEHVSDEDSDDELRASVSESHDSARSDFEPAAVVIDDDNEKALELVEEQTAPARARRPMMATGTRRPAPRQLPQIHQAQRTIVVTAKSKHKVGFTSEWLEDFIWLRPVKDEEGEVVGMQCSLCRQHDARSVQNKKYNLEECTCNCISP